MKQCSKCKQTKSLNEFSIRNDRNIHMSKCKTCRNAHSTTDYQNNQLRKEKAIKRIKANQLIVEKFIVDYLLNNPCSCGQTNILTLQFDHLRDKKFNLCYGITQGYSLAQIKSEIEKCQVLCANCHSAKTASQFGNWKLKWLAHSDLNRDPTG